MNSAQVASIAKSANEVSSHIISGFFNMIGSELSQNMAALAAKFKAVFELLTPKSSTLEKQQVVMQDDYNCVSNPKSSDSVQKINEAVKSYFVSNYSNTNTEYERKQINEAFSLIAEREFQNLTDEKSRRVYEVLTKLKEN